jgi:hypothetical protein
MLGAWSGIHRILSSFPASIPFVPINRPRTMMSPERSDPVACRSSEVDGTQRLSLTHRLVSPKRATDSVPEHQRAGRQRLPVPPGRQSQEWSAPRACRRPPLLKSRRQRQRAAFVLPSLVEHINGPRTASGMPAERAAGSRVPRENVPHFKRNGSPGCRIAGSSWF